MVSFLLSICSTESIFSFIVNHCVTSRWALVESNASVSWCWCTLAWFLNIVITFALDSGRDTMNWILLVVVYLKYEGFQTFLKTADVNDHWTLNNRATLQLVIDQWLLTDFCQSLTLLDMLHDPQGFSSRPASHGHMILCGSTGWQGVHRRWMTQNFILWHCKAKKKKKSRVTQINLASFILFICLLTQSSGSAVSNHEARVESTLIDQEGGQLTQRWVTQPFDPPLADRGQLVDCNR